MTILRKRLEKVRDTLYYVGSLIQIIEYLQTVQEHLAQLAKLKAAKEESDAKHIVIQKQYEADKERLRTELTFRVRNVYILGRLIKCALAT